MPPKLRPDPESLEVGIAAGLLVKFPGRFLMQPRLEEVAPQATWKKSLVQAQSQDLNQSLTCQREQGVSFVFLRLISLDLEGT